MKTSRIGTFIKQEAFLRTLMFFTTVIIFMVVILSYYPFKRYVYVAGDVSRHNILAPYDIEDEFATKQLAIENQNEVEPYPSIVPDSMAKSYGYANTFFQYIYDLRKFHQNTKEDEDSEASSTYTLTLNDFNKWLNSIEVVLTNDQIDFLASKVSDAEYERFMNITYQILYDYTKESIDDSNLSDSIVDAQNDYRQKGLDANIVSIGQAVIKNLIFVNEVEDSFATAEFRDKIYYETLVKDIVLIEKGEVIVEKGEVITNETYELLDSLNLLRDEGLLGYLNYFFILLFVMIVSFFFIYYLKVFYTKMYHGMKEYIIMLVILAITLLSIRFGLIVSPYFLPVMLLAVLASILLDLRVAVMMNFVICLIATVFIPDIRMIVVQFISGAFMAFLVYDKKQRAKLLIAGLLASVFSTILFVIVMVFTGEDFIEMSKVSYIVFLSGVFSIIIGIGILPLFESIFNVITPFKLLELSNPNHPLLKRLLMEAPGTYHHSLMVGNLAEVATRRIGGDALLARVGAYYHDIGKIERPNLFTENQISENPHDKMNPKLSAFVITSHVNDGIKLANTNKLPKAIKDIIASHHGNTLIAYFYHKAKNTGDDGKVNADDYRYKAPRPSSKESAVVLLADSCEAAVRSLEDKSKGKVEGFIRKIIKGKLDDGQLDLCDLTLKDLDEIARGFVDVLSGYFHERVKYPSDSDKEKKQNLQEEIKKDA